jgi:hypothetical protein
LKSIAIAEFERRRAEVETNLRLAVAQGVADLEAAERRHQFARLRLEAHQSRTQLLAISYRLGDGSTEEMLGLWQAGEELRGQVVTAEADVAHELSRLRALVSPQP